MSNEARVLQELICLSCPNGCRLVINEHLTDGLIVDGHKCDKGLAFAQQRIQTESGHDVRGRAAMFSSGFSEGTGLKSKHLGPSYSREYLAEVFGLWGQVLEDLHPEINMTGSPERTEFRIVLENAEGELFILEQIPATKMEHKRRIAELLRYLTDKNLPHIQTYLLASNGHFIQQTGGRYWQLIPYIKGDALNRKAYLYDAWRGRALAHFLVELRQCSDGVPGFDPRHKFSLPKYIHQLYHQIERHKPQVISSLKPIRDFLEERFMSTHDDLPVAFCHGDYHPLNVIWGDQNLLCVIDWEFCGYKAELYDLANLTGCLGMEHPSSLVNNLVMTLLAELRAAKIFADQSWDFLPDFIVASRFAWLSEWLRREDTEMIEMELFYVKLLVEEREKLRREWGLPHK